MFKKKGITINETGHEVEYEYYEGFCVDLAKLIADFVGFEYEIRLVKDGKYGAKEKNGTWSGMVGELVRHVSYSYQRRAWDWEFQWECESHGNPTGMGQELNKT